MEHVGVIGADCSIALVHCCSRARGVCAACVRRRNPLASAGEQSGGPAQSHLGRASFNSSVPSATAPPVPDSDANLAGCRANIAVDFTRGKPSDALSAGLERVRAPTPPCALVVASAAASLS